MNANKEELLKKLEELKNERKELSERFYFDSTNDALDRELDCYDQAITRTEIEYDVTLMYDYLISKGARHAAWMKNSDCGVYKIAKCGELTYLEYMIDYYEYNKDPYHLRKLDHGKIVHDKDGNIIFEEHALDVPNRESYKFDRSRISYEEIDAEEAFAYHDDKNFIIQTKEERTLKFATLADQIRMNREHPAYKHYQLRNGKYVLVNTLIQDSSELNFKLLKTNSSRKLSQCFGRLYDIDKGDYLTKASFKEILDKTSGTSDMPWLGCPLALAREQIVGLMQKKNLLVAKEHIIIAYDATVDTMVYLDTNGNIVSDLLYYVNLVGRDELDQQREIRSIATTDETYCDDLSKVIKLSGNYRKEALAKIEEKENKKYDIKSHILKMRTDNRLSLIANGCNKKN